MSTALITGLKRKIEELEETAREHKKSQSRHRVLEEKVRAYEMMMTDIQNPLACSICANDTQDVLPCKHRVCTTCVNHLTSATMSDYTCEMKCPCCRTSYFFNVNQNAVEVIDKDFTSVNTHTGIRKSDARAFRSYMMHYIKVGCEWIYNESDPFTLKRSISI